MAHALGLSDQGTPTELEERIATALVQRTRERVLLIEIVQPIVPRTHEEVEAVFTLVAGLWASLIERARQPSKVLPAFLHRPGAGRSQPAQERCWVWRSQYGYLGDPTAIQRPTRTGGAL